MSKTVDFGAPPDFCMHHFYVEIPAAPRDSVVIYEDYGFDGTNLVERPYSDVLFWQESYGPKFVTMHAGTSTVA